MRIIYLEPLTSGDIEGIFQGHIDSTYRIELRNDHYDSVFLRDPILRRRVIYGVTIVDPICPRIDRIFGKHTNMRVPRGTQPLAESIKR